MTSDVMPHPKDPKPRDQKRKEEEKLDQAIEDSMIASDPPARVSQGKPTAPARRKPR